MTAGSRGLLLTTTLPSHLKALGNLRGPFQFHQEEHPMFHSVAARVRERRYTNCVVVGCDSSVRGLSRLCNAHHIRRARHGSPTGRPILRSGKSVV